MSTRTIDSTYAAQATAGSSGLPDFADASSVAVDSQNLLRGNKAVTIQHNGVLYRLQSTRLGKLILTK